jgi:hypothetical protein
MEGEDTLTIKQAARMAILTQKVPSFSPEADARVFYPPCPENGSSDPADKERIIWLGAGTFSG